MVTLILNTSYNLEVAILKDKKLILHHISKDKKADTYMQMIDKALSEANIKIADVSDLLVNIGPGSFTGVRITVSIAKGLTFGSKIKIHSFTSFDSVNNSENKAIVLPGFSNFVYVKMSDGAMDCVSIDSLGSLKYVTVYKDLCEDLKQKGINVNFVENLSFYDLFEKSVKVDSIKDLKPVYLRKSQAEINLETIKRRD